MKKYFSKLTLAIVAAIVLSLGVAVPAMAATAPLEAVEIGVTKRINVAQGTTMPELNFDFVFTLLEAQTAPATGYVASSATSPNIPTRTANFPAGLTVPASNFLEWQTNPANILTGVSWPHAGDFVFGLHEAVNTNTAIAAADDMFLRYNINNDAYILVVRVSNCEATGTLVPTEATAARATFTLPGTDGTPGTDSVWDRTDPKFPNYTPGEEGTDPTSGERVLVDPSDIRFTNGFSRDSGNDLEDPALAITKYVAAQDQGNRTLPFSFTIELTIPEEAMNRTTPPGWSFPTGALAPSATTVAAPGVAISPPAVGGLTGTGPSFTVTVELTHGQRIAFPVLPEGTRWAVTEAATATYTPSAVVTVAGTAVTGSPFSSAIGTALRVPAADATPNTFYTSGTGTGADFTNTRTAPPITGLVVGSMPIIAVLLGATALLAMAVASRSRQRIEQLPVAY